MVIFPIDKQLIMDKFDIKDIIRFKRRKEPYKKGFLISLENREKIKKANKERNEKSRGGDFWVICLRAIEAVFKTNEKNSYDNKIKILEGKIEKEKVRRNKVQYEANLNVMLNFTDFDFSEVIPGKEIKILSHAKETEIIDINGLSVKANPTIIFSFENEAINEIGGISFIAQKEGFKKSELGIFTETYFKYLNKNYFKDYVINPHYIIAIDVVEVKMVRHDQILNGEIVPLLESTIEEIKKLLK